MTLRSQNGWPVLAGYSDKRLVNIPKIIGKVRAGDVATVLAHLVENFDRTVEDVDAGRDDWGFAPRTIRGASTDYSNHASGTAVDLNATRHPLGARGTFTRAQADRIRRMCRNDYAGLIRWGGDYTGRADEMHFEVIGTASQIEALARRLTAAPAGTGYPAAALLVDGDFGPLTVKALQAALSELTDDYTGLVDGDFGPLTVKAVQTWMARLGYYPGLVDGDFGPLTVKALQRFLSRRGHYPGLVDGDFGPLTVKALQQYLNEQKGYFRG